MKANFTYLMTGETNSNNTYRTGCYENLATDNYFDNPIGEYRYDWFVIRNGVRTDCTKIFTIHEGESTLIEVFY